MSDLRYLRHKRAKGRSYWYFDTGQRTTEGKPILTRLPDKRDLAFGGAYARALAARTQRSNTPNFLTLEALVYRYERSPEFRGLAVSSRRIYSRYLATAARLIRTTQGGSPSAAAVQTNHILQLREKLADTPGAANAAVRALGAMFAWALDHGLIRSNPVRGVKKFKAKPHEPWPEALVEEALADPQVGMAVALLYFTGQRIDDVVRMQWNDIRGDWMRVHIKKKNKEVRVAILPELAEMLARQERKAAVTILTNANDRPWTQSGLRQKLQDWAKARGHKVVPHGLRKNAVNSLFEAGCTAAEVAGITDQSIGMLEHYALGVNKITLGRAAVVKFDAARRQKNVRGK